MNGSKILRFSASVSVFILSLNCITSTLGTAKCLYSLLKLHHQYAGYSALDCRLPSVFQALLHCLLASTIPLQRSDVITIPEPLFMMSFFLRGSVRIFSSLGVLKFISVVNKCDFLSYF